MFTWGNPRCDRCSPAKKEVPGGPRPQSVLFFSVMFRYWPVRTKEAAASQETAITDHGVADGALQDTEHLCFS